MCTNVSVVYGKDIEEPPAYLDAAFFREVLEHAIRSARVQLKSINVTLGSAIGENYCSKIYRVCIEYERTTRTGERIDKTSSKLSVIVKSMPVVGGIDFLQDLQVYLKERLTYNEVLPRLEILLGGQRKFGAKLYHSRKTPYNTLVFEDLSQHGFVLASREKGLDEAHCRLVMQRLAEFHATSIALVKRDPTIFETYDCGMLAKTGLERDDSLLLSHFGGNVKQLHELISSWQGYESIAQKIGKYIENLRERLVESQEPLAHEFKVLNHGDLWVNNMLFKYDKNGNNVEDVVFIDYQLSIYGSPGIDLNYFFYTSLTLDVLQEKRLELIREYHTRLTETLNNLGLADAAPSYETILEEVRRRETYGFFANYGIFPLISQSKSETADNKLESFLDEEYAKRKTAQMFQSKRLHETLHYTLPYFDNAGVFA